MSFYSLVTAVFQSVTTLLCVLCSGKCLLLWKLRELFPPDAGIVQSRGKPWDWRSSTSACLGFGICVGVSRGGLGPGFV